MTIKIAKSKKIKKTLSDLSNIAKFLEEAGFIDAAEKVHCAMDAVDGSFTCDKEDNLNESAVTMTPDVQNALPGSMPVHMTGEVFTGSPHSFNAGIGMPIAALRIEMVKLANDLDQKGMYDEADELDGILKELLDSEDDEMLEIIEELEEDRDDKKKKKVKPDEDDKEGVGVLVDSNGHVGTGVTDNQNAGMFQGFSDAYFYSGYGNLEGPYK